MATYRPSAPVPVKLNASWIAIQVAVLASDQVQIIVSPALVVIGGPAVVFALNALTLEEYGQIPL